MYWIQYLYEYVNDNINSADAILPVVFVADIENFKKKLKKKKKKKRIFIV